MKKILLVPLMAISLLVGCNTKEQEEKDTLYTPMDWFKDTDVIENDLAFYVDLYKVTDYDKEVSNKLLKAFDTDFKHPKKINEVDSYDLMSYTIKKNMGPYTDFTIYIHERSVETRAVGRLNNRQIEQCVRYDTYGVLGTSLLITYAARRADTIHTIQKEEYDAAEEANTFKNFYEQIEESTTNPTVKFSNVTKEDTGHALLDDIKDLFGKYGEKAYGANKGEPFMSYGLSEDFALRFYLDKVEGCIALLEYTYQSTFGYSNTIDFGYEVSREKVDNIIDKVTGVAN